MKGFSLHTPVLEPQTKAQIIARSIWYYRQGGQPAYDPILIKCHYQSEQGGRCGFGSLLSAGCAQHLDAINIGGIGAIYTIDRLISNRIEPEYTLELLSQLPCDCNRYDGIDTLFALQVAHDRTARFELQEGKTFAQLYEQEVKKRVYERDFEAAMRLIERFPEIPRDSQHHKDKEWT